MHYQPAKLHKVHEGFFTASKNDTLPCVVHLIEGQFG